MRRAWVFAAAVVLAAGCDVQPYRLAGGGLDGGGAGGDAGNSGGDGGGGADGGTCIPTGPDDTCDGVDNDCNGTVDDDFDLDNDGENCGMCGNRCTAPGAILECVDAACSFVECQPGFVDLDPQAPGCEYQCPLFPGQPEECNGVDDDCDGDVDEVAELPPPPAGQCRETAGTPCEGVSMVCDTRGTPPETRWYCDYPAEVEFDPTVPNGILLQETLCDGHDGDCDGVPDDPFTDLGQECDNGAQGICRDVGARACDPGDPTQTFCDLSVLPDPLGTPTAEVCNGLDDNCDGTVDNATGPDRVVEDMVNVTHGGNDFWIYRYEASRPDATDADEGADERRSCSNAGALPWRNVSFAAAASACADAGFRLCTADEYLAACEGAAASVFPYGDAFEPDTCNAEPFDGDAMTPQDDDILIATGAAATCTTDDGVFDLSGNVKEWTDDITGQTPDGVDIAVLRGGSYDTPAGGATCGFRTSRAAVNTVLPTIGFRCCSSAPP